MNASHLRRAIAALAVVVMCGMIASDADARAGGGFSGGSRGSRTFSAPAATQTAPSPASPIQRSVTQPARPTTGAAPVSSPGGFFNRPGLLGGLAAGFLGAGLFGLLFGHGLFGGLGGFASILGLILQVGLVVLIGTFLWRMWQRRQQQPAFAGGPMPRDIGGSGFGAAAAGGGAPVGNVDVTPADFDTFERLLGDVQTAFSAEDLNGLRARVTPEMLSYFSEQLSGNASRGVVNQVTGVKLLQGDLSEAWRENGVDYATVAMRFALVDRTVERSTGRVVDGSDTPQEATELWTFMRAPGGGWLLSAIQQS